MKIQFHDKNNYGCYWDTPEGKLFDAKNTDQYLAQLEKYSTLSQKTLPPEKMEKPRRVVTKNLSETARLHYQKEALPKVLQQR